MPRRFLTLINPSSTNTSEAPSPKNECGQDRHGLRDRFRRSSPRLPEQGQAAQKLTQDASARSKSNDTLEIVASLRPSGSSDHDEEQTPSKLPNNQTTNPPANQCPPLTTNIWALALGDLESSNPELMQDFESSLGLYDNNSASIQKGRQIVDADTAVSYPNSNAAQVALAGIEAFRDNKTATLGRSAQFRNCFEETVRLVLSAKDVISSAVAFNPIAASAWTGVSLVLPLFVNSTTENQAAIEGLNYVTVLLVEYRWKEKTFLSADASDDFITTARKLYASILEYEALLYAHMQHNPLSRFKRNLLHSGDWKTRLESLKKLDSDCRTVTDAITEARAYEWLSEERQWQQTLLDQPRQKTEEANLQKLYVNYEYDKNPKNMRVPGTCEWFLKHPEFLTWRDSHASGLLWLTADPGCGKSVLAKYLMDQRAEVLSVNAESPTFCYFFFIDGDKDRGDAAKAMCALLYQLFLQKPLLYKYAASDFEKKGHKFLTDLNALWRIFVAAINDKELEEVICVLDGLDECESVSRRALVPLLVELHLGFHKISDVAVTRKLLITSRPYLEIERGFRELTNTIPSIRLSGERETQSIRHEINLVLDARIRELAISNNLSSQARDALHERLSSIEHRTYLWLKLILEFLGDQNEIKARDVPRLITSIPANIEEAYDNILGRSNDPVRARQLLHYVLAAVRPLSVMEMNVLMNIDDDCHTKDDIELWTASVMESTVKNICGLFVIIVDSRIHLIHQTARDYLICMDEKRSAATPSHVGTGWKHTFRLQESELVIAKSCVLFLSLEDFENKTLTVGNWKMRNIKEYALFTYAARNWPHHLANASCHGDAKALHERTVKLFGSIDDYPFKLWIEEYRKAADPYSYFPLGRSTMMWAAYFGQNVIVAELLSTGHDPNAVDSVGRTALSFAAYGGHLGVVSELLLKKADADPKDIIGQSPLLLSIQGQHLAVSEALLVSNADIYSPDVFGRSAMSYCGPQMKKSLRYYLPTAEIPERGSQDTTQSITLRDISSELAQISANIQAYLMLCHESGQWQSLHQHTILASTNSLPSGISQLYNALLDGIAVVNSGNDAWYDEGRFQILSAFTCIRAFIVAESSLLLIYVARLIAYAWCHQKQRLACAVLRQMSATANTCHDNTYPLTIILAKVNELLSTDHGEVYQILNCILQTCFETWDKLLGPQHMQVVHTQHIQLEITSWYKGPESVTNDLHQLSTQTDSAHGLKSIQSLQILRYVVQNLLDCKNLAAAKDNACTLCSRVGVMVLEGNNQRYFYLLCESLRMLAEAQSGLREFDDAEKSYRSLLEKAENSWGPLYIRTRKYRRMFGLWLMDCGRVEEAMLYGV